MRVAAIYDIHGNLPALEAVLQEIHQEKVDRLIVGGDVVPGPMPRETLACLKELDIPVRYIRGNGEVAVLQQMGGEKPAEVPEAFRSIIEWTAKELDPDHERWLASWPKTLSEEISGMGGVVFCHASPRNENEIFTRSTPQERLFPIFIGLDTTLVICGHTHMQFDRTICGIRVVNAGSVGMPFGEPGAYWLMLGPQIQLRHTSYDLVRAAERIRATHYPQARDFADRNVLQPPSEVEMLQIFSQVELK